MTLRVGPLPPSTMRPPLAVGKASNFHGPFLSFVWTGNGACFCRKPPRALNSMLESSPQTNIGTAAPARVFSLVQCGPLRGINSVQRNACKQRFATGYQLQLWPAYLHRSRNIFLLFISFFAWYIRSGHRHVDARVAQSFFGRYFSAVEAVGRALFSGS